MRIKKVFKNKKISPKAYFSNAHTVRPINGDFVAITLFELAV